MTSNPNARWAGPTFAVSLVALVLTASLDLNVLDGAGHRVFRYSRGELEDRIVVVNQIEMQPGDVVRVYPEGLHSGPIARSDFLIVEAGDGKRMRNGQAPEHTYRSFENLAVDVTNAVGWVHFERPVPPPGFEPSRLDLVWVFHFKPDDSPPADPEARRFFYAWAFASTDLNQPVAVEAGAIQFHRAAVVALWVLAAMAAASGLVWGVQSWRRSQVPPGAGPTESLLRLAQLGGAYLRRLRGLLLALAVPLLYVGWATAHAVGYYAEWTAGPDAGWLNPIQIGLLGVWFALVLVWGISTLRVEVAYRRWRRQSRDLPAGF